MKKFLIIALAATLLVSGGIFATTYTTATATISVTAATSDFAQVTAEDVSALAPTIFGNYVGTWASGTIFTITPDDDYTGDLVIKAHLVNTGALSRYYEHCNMSLEFLDTDNSTADEQQIAQILNLQNSEVLFTWANGTGNSPYKIKLTGGSYRLHPWKTLTGGSYQPQLWCEIEQR
ncbi:hypothetical protein ACFLWW_01530 [Chloroflexota bacterium]